MLRGVAGKLRYQTSFPNSSAVLGGPCPLNKLLNTSGLNDSLTASYLHHSSSSTTVNMGFYNAAPAPPTPLGRYRALSKHASVHVSPLVLGAMSIGDAWSAIGFGSMDKQSSFKLLDAFYEAGGNFIDTANN
jgi:hypothetical protein